ncbi:MAG: hypothetical protein ACOX83_08195, partial [Candidatus Spyradocola sp.]
EEETRLMYVAVTRARERFTAPAAERAFGEARPESRFLSRLLDERPAAASKPRARSGRTEAAPERPRRSAALVQALFRARPFPRHAPEEVRSPEEIRPGMRVLHLVFGEGEVVSLGPRTQMRVRFGEQERTLDAGVCARGGLLWKL